MSKISIEGNASGTGTLTIAAPNTNTNYTLALPEEAGTITTSNSPYSTFRNRIINGDMRIDQRNAGASVTPTNTQYLVDRFQATLTQASKFTVQQSSTAPVGFVNSLLATSSSAYSVGTGDVFAIRQRIEGTNVADFGWGTANAKTVTVSFWVRSSLTGTFGAGLTNSGSTRNYPFTYTISVADTWEYKTVTIAGDTSGTWLTTTGIGVALLFGLGSGSDFSGTANAWNGTTNAFLPTGATSVVGTLNATWYITGVQLEVGSVATPFERRPYTTELQLCQRYCPVIMVNGSTWIGAALSTTSSYPKVYFPVETRVPATGITVSSAGHFVVFSFNNGAAGACTSVAFSSADTFGAWLVTATTAGTPTLAAGHITQFYGSNASARLLFTGCEL